MKSLLLIGGGGHCRSCIDVIEATEKYRIDGVVLQNNSSQRILGYPVVGCDDDLPKLIHYSELALVTVGQVQTPKIRIRLYDLLKRLKAELPIVISPRAYCSRHTHIGDGTIVMHGAVINAGARIGNNCIINTHSIVEHDVQINDHCHISTGARVNGNVTIGKGSFIGSGAIIKQGIEIGENVIIGAGQVILGNVQSHRVLKNDRKF